MGGGVSLIGNGEDFFGCDELDAVIPAEVASLVFEPIRIGAWIALIGVSDQCFAIVRKTTIRDQIHTLISDEPKAGS